MHCGLLDWKVNQLEMCALHKYGLLYTGNMITNINYIYDVYVDT
jgi:hypothetical protein